MRVLWALPIVLAGCAGSPARPEPEIITKRVEVPIAAPCLKRAEVPLAPRYPADQLSRDLPLEKLAQAFVASYHMARADAERLRAVLEACIE